MKLNGSTDIVGILLKNPHNVVFHPFLNSLLDQVAGFDFNFCYEDENDKTLLHVACDHEDLEAAKLLVSKGRAKVNVVNPNLRITPIHVAARKGNVDLMR